MEIVHLFILLTISKNKQTILYLIVFSNNTLNIKNDERVYKGL